MLKLLGSTFVLLAFVSHDASAQERRVATELEDAYLLSKNKEPYSYAQIFKKYRLVIFARIEDCSACISKDSPWIQMIRDKSIPACFVFMNRSLRKAKYYYQVNSLPFEFYCDTSRAAVQIVTDKNTPVVLAFDEAGSQTFFDNPLSEMKRFITVIDSIDSPRGRKK